MFLLKFLKCIFLVNLFCVVSEAYFVATDAGRFKSGIPTDVFVAGYGDDQGRQFLTAAILGAQVSRDRFLERQRTNNVPYADGFGKFAKGLGFYKVFSSSERIEFFCGRTSGLHAFKMLHQRKMQWL